MNISSINNACTKPQTFFKGRDSYDEEFDALVDKTDTLKDSCNFSKDTKEAKEGEDEANNKKDFVGILLSLAVAGILTYGGGKIVAKKAASVFPKPAAFLSKHLAKFGDGKVLTGLENTLSKGKTIGKFGAKGVGKFRNMLKSDQALPTVAGLGTLVAGTTKIATTDGNKDGINDIAQKNVNVYKSVLNDLGTVGDVVKILA